MSVATIELERELLDMFHPIHGRLEDKVTEYLVLELYRRREISSGRAAELLGMQRLEFIRYASRLGIPYLDLDEMELQEEISLARRER
jgi:predicted HTH domain antitoxin